MITLNLQIGPNPLAAHKPKALLTHPATPRIFSLGEEGDLVAWQEGRPLFQLCPSLSCENDRLLASTIACLREPDQVRPSLRVATLHCDNRLRIWACDDGACLQVSPAGLFPQLTVALLAPEGESRFLFAVAAEAVFVFDCWFMRVACRMAPKKESFVRFRGGCITGNTLELWDSGNRAYRIDIAPLLSQQLLDYGFIVTDQLKAETSLARITEGLTAPTPVTAYRRPQAIDPPSLQYYQAAAAEARQETVLEAVCATELQQVYPQLETVLGEEKPTTGSLNFVGGSTLFMFVGTASGCLLILPASIRSGEPLVLIKDARHADSPVDFLRVVGNMLIASWESGWLGIYSLQNLVSHLQTVRINRTLEKGGTASTAVFTADLSRLAATQQRLSSSVRSLVPAYHSQQGPVRSSLFLRLERNELARFDELGSQLSYLRGISEQEIVHCVCLIEQYAAVCTSKAVELYSALGHQRSISYDEWKWQDYPFFQTASCPSPAPPSIIETSSRWAWDQLDYYSGGEELVAEALGEGVGVGGEGWAEFFFRERAAVLAGVHSRSADCSAAVLRCKLDKVRRDSWGNCTYLLHGSLNQELEAFQAQRAPPRQILARQYDFYLLLPCHDLPVPFLSHELRQAGRRTCLRSRVALQGAGRSFTVLFEGANRIRLSERLLCHEAVACVSLLQVWVVKEAAATDHMVEAVEYFARLAACLCPEEGEMALAKLAVSPSQNVSKASINVTISRAMTSAGSLHPTLAYFLLSQREKRSLDYCEAVWLSYLGLGCLFGGLKPEKEQLRQLVGRFVAVMTDCSNYQRQMHLLLAVMRAFNEGVARWRPLLEADAGKLLVDLLRVFFWFDGLASVPADDKKFNFCFAGCDEPSRRAAKQGIVKTIMYVGKEFGQELLGALREESGNQKVHAAYPASVVEVLRQFIKSERPQTHLVFYVELLLQCLSPMNPQLRKYVQRNALSTLQLLCTYPNVSFNQPSQKLSLKTHNHLYIYCLRTSTKWRTINLKDEPHNAPALVEMSPKGTYIALLSDKLRVWRLSSGFWSGMLAPFSQDRVFEATGKALRWDETEDSLTVINEDPARNQVFRI